MKASFILLVLVTLMLRMNGSGQSAQLPPASDMKTIGLIGGTSWYSTVDYYRYINEAVNDAYGNNTNPPLILYNMNQERIHELQAKGQWDEIAALLTPSNYPARVEQGIFKAESKKYVLQQIEELRKRGAQGIVLGCTEFPLIIKSPDVEVPLFDTTRLHSQMAVDFILGQQGLARVRPDQ